MRAFVRLRETFKPDALRLLPIACGFTPIAHILLPYALPIAYSPSPLALEIS